MTRLCWIAAVLFGLAAPFSADEKKDDGFVPLFNGKDLTGWVNVNGAPGTFFVKDGEVITTGKPHGYLRTAKQYENFIAEFEWLHVNKTEVGNSGFFVWGDPLPAVGSPFTRGIEVQVLVNLEKEDAYTSHGDLFSIQGATCKPDRPHPMGWLRCLPSERRAKGGGEWNHYQVIAKDGTLKLHVNGKEVSGLSQCKPRKGYLALESEGAECHFRNLKIKELPSGHPKKDEIAEEAKGHSSLFDGLTLDGWKTGEEAGKKAWTARNGVLAYKKPDSVPGSALETSKEYGDVDLMVDYRLPKPKEGQKESVGHISLARGITVVPSSEPGKLVIKGPETGIKLKEEPKLKAGEWNRVQVTIQGGRVTVMVNGTIVVENQEVKDLASKGSIGIAGSETVEFRNLFLREFK